MVRATFHRKGMRTRENETERPPLFRLGATVVAQPLIGNFNILRPIGGFMAVRVAASPRSGSKAGQACVCIGVIRLGAKLWLRVKCEESVAPRERSTEGGAAKLHKL